MTGAYLAQMSTEHFDFVALGRNQNEARRAVSRKLNEFRKKVGQRPMSMNEMVEKWGLTVQFVPLGVALVDGEPFYTSADDAPSR